MRKKLLNDGTETSNDSKEMRQNIRQIQNVKDLSNVRDFIDVGEGIKDYTNFLSDFNKQMATTNTINDTVNFIGGLGLDFKGNKLNLYDTKFNNDDELYLRRQELKKVNAELKEALEQRENTEDLYQRQLKTYSELEEQIKIKHILSRINIEGQQKAISSTIFLDKFKDKNQCNAVVLSIDIRRSTELMLKAKEPKLFSEFITKLTFLLSDCIANNYGVFDKFTGDGILAFFPDFYSGDDAIVRALKAAEECHLIFDKHYKESRYSFNVFITDVGLGIGVDFGNVTVVNTTNELTVVGIPVVYACRLSGAPAGTTILNQGAFLEIQRKWSSQISFTESEIMIKNEGKAGVFNVAVNQSVYISLQTPDWSIYADNDSEKTGESTADEQPLEESEPTEKVSDNDDK